jgi:primosomal replication protein N
MTEQERTEIKDKIQKGFEISYEKFLAEKKAKNEELVVVQDGKIVTIKP